MSEKEWREREKKVRFSRMEEISANDDECFFLLVGLEIKAPSAWGKKHSLQSLSFIFLAEEHFCLQN